MIQTFTPLPLHVLAKKFQERLVASLILRLDPLVVQVRARRHPAVDLVSKRLDMVGHLEILLKLLDVLWGLISRRQEGKGDGEAFSIGRVDHGRVSRGRGNEGVCWCLDCESNNFTAPAVLLFRNKKTSVSSSMIDTSSVDRLTPSKASLETDGLWALTPST